MQSVIAGAKRPSMEVSSPRGKIYITLTNKEDLTGNQLMEKGHVFEWPCTLTQIQSMHLYTIGYLQQYEHK